ncbi:MAG: signal peptidase II [Candidatus Woesearchaeota archaeon]
MAVKKSILYWTALIVLILDVFTKLWVRNVLPVGASESLLPFLSITHVQNYGVAFGMLNFEAFRWVFVLLAIGVAIVIAVSCQHNKLKEHFVLWGLIMGGALGNALDRIFIGTVTDFIDFHFWPAFNVADCALTVGIILLLIHSFKKEE